MEYSVVTLSQNQEEIQCNNMKKNIIVYSLWGDKPMYWVGAQKNIELAKELYPGWICRFYIDESCDSESIKSLNGDNVEIILMKQSDYRYKNLSDKFNHQGLFWRFFSLADSSVDCILSRDCDSRLSKRESDAVNEWLSSGKKFHIMRDHPYHTVPILAGMWGCKRGILYNIEDLLRFWSTHPKRGVFDAEDQDFLGQIVYPIIKEDVMEHSEFGINFGNSVINFPTTRKDYEFVGDVFDEKNERHQDYWKIIKK